MPWLRNVLAYVAFTLALPMVIAHPKLRRGYRQRFGLYRARELPGADGPRVWMHGASAGDVLALLPTIRALRERLPEVQVIISTTTNTGWAMAKRYRDELASVVYQPYDLPGSVARALRKIRPDVLVVEYTELWPQLIFGAHRAGARLVLHNGRFSRARLPRYRTLFRLVGDLLTPFSALLLRDEDEAESARMLGATEEQIRVTGNTKFDNLPTEPPEAKRQELSHAVAADAGDLIWVAGSTHEGEDEALLRIFAKLRKAHANLRLVIAPRYIDRATRIEQLCDRHSLSHRRRTADGARSDVVILDTIGELATLYALADVVFVGGSFTSRGGQNILEPAACGKPVLFGPHMENFADAVKLLLGRGGVQVADEEQLERVLDDLLRRESYRQELGVLAKGMVASVRGAAKRNAKEIVAALASG